MTSRSPAVQADRWHVEIPTPVGALRVVTGPTAIVGLYHADHAPEPPPRLLGRHVVVRAESASGPPTPEPALALLHRAEVELGEYFARVRHEFAVPVDLHGTDFQRSVWAALQDIPYGQRRSYHDIAGDLGNPRMGRAVGAAVRANPVSIIVPGHRVVSRAGTILGYAAGTATKTALLDLEAVVRTAPS